MATTFESNHEERHQALVAQLVRDLKPVRRLWPVGVRFVCWVGLEAIVVAWAIAHARVDFAGKIGHPAYALGVTLSAAGALVAAWFALRSALPDRSWHAAQALVVVTLLGAVCASIAVGGWLSIAYPSDDFIGRGMICATGIFLLAALPWAGLWWAVRRGAPLHGAVSGFWVGAAALLGALAMMRVICPIDDPLHLLVWHVMPVLLVTALSIVLGAVGLHFRPHRVSA